MRSVPAGLVLAAALTSAAPAHAAVVTADSPVFANYAQAGAPSFLVVLCGVTADTQAQTTVSRCTVGGVDRVYLPNDGTPLVRVDEMSMQGPKAWSLWVGAIDTPVDACSSGYAWYRTSGTVFATPACVTIR